VTDIHKVLIKEREERVAGTAQRGQHCKNAKSSTGKEAKKKKSSHESKWAMGQL